MCELQRRHQRLHHQSLSTLEDKTEATVWCVDNGFLATLALPPYTLAFAAFKIYPILTWQQVKKKETSFMQVIFHLLRWDKVWPADTVNQALLWVMDMEEGRINHSLLF